MALVENRQAGGLHRRDFAADIPEALHRGFELSFAAAGVASVGIPECIHRPAHQGQGLVDRHLIGGHAGVGDQKRGGGKSGDSSADDVGALFFDAFRRQLVDAIVVSHVWSVPVFTAGLCLPMKCETDR